MGFKTFKWSLILLLVIYLALYFGTITGYYDYKNYKKMTLTNEQIIRFEKDVKAGKEVNVEDYLVKEDIAYNNKIANTGKRLSFMISGGMNKVLNKTFSLLGKFIEE